LEQIKIDRFRKEMGGKPFPRFETLPDDEREKVVSNIARRVMSGKGKKIRELVDRIGAIQTPVKGVNAQDPDFDLAEIFGALNIHPKEEIFLGWNGYAVVDRIRATDFTGYLGFIWSPGSDRIDVFDSGYKWLLTIGKEGSIRYLWL
jgi:hypothetical protein